MSAKKPLVPVSQSKVKNTLVGGPRLSTKLTPRKSESRSSIATYQSTFIHTLSELRSKIQEAKVQIVNSR